MEDRFIFILVFLLISVSFAENINATSQEDDFRKKYQTQTLLYGEGVLKGRYYSFPSVGEIYRFHWMGVSPKFKDLLSRSTNTVLPMAEFRKAQQVGHSFFWIGIGGLGIVGGLTAAKVINPDALSLLIVGGAGLLATAIGAGVLGGSHQFIHRAVWDYNRDMLFRDDAGSRAAHHGESVFSVVQLQAMY